MHARLEKRRTYRKQLLATRAAQLHPLTFDLYMAETLGPVQQSINPPPHRPPKPEWFPPVTPTRHEPQDLPSKSGSSSTAAVLRNPSARSTGEGVEEFPDAGDAGNTSCIVPHPPIHPKKLRVDPEDPPPAVLRGNPFHVRHNMIFRRGTPPLPHVAFEWDTAAKVQTWRPPTESSPAGRATKKTGRLPFLSTPRPHHDSNLAREIPLLLSDGRVGDGVPQPHRSPRRRVGEDGTSTTACSQQRSPRQLPPRPPLSPEHLQMLRSSHRRAAATHRKQLGELMVALVDFESSRRRALVAASEVEFAKMETCFARNIPPENDIQARGDTNTNQTLADRRSRHNEMEGHKMMQRLARRVSVEALAVAMHTHALTEDERCRRNALLSAEQDERRRWSRPFARKILQLGEIQGRNAIRREHTAVLYDCRTSFLLDLEAQLRRQLEDRQDEVFDDVVLLVDVIRHTTNIHQREEQLRVALEDDELHDRLLLECHIRLREVSALEVEARLELRRRLTQSRREVEAREDASRKIQAVYRGSCGRKAARQKRAERTVAQQHDMTAFLETVHLEVQSLTSAKRQLNVLRIQERVDSSSRSTNSKPQKSQDSVRRTRDDSSPVSPQRADAFQTKPPTSVTLRSLVEELENAFLASLNAAAQQSKLPETLASHSSASKAAHEQHHAEGNENHHERSNDDYAAAIRRYDNAKRELRQRLPALLKTDAAIGRQESSRKLVHRIVDILLRESDEVEENVAFLNELVQVPEAQMGLVIAEGEYLLDVVADGSCHYLDVILNAADLSVTPQHITKVITAALGSPMCRLLLAGTLLRREYRLLSLGVAPETMSLLWNSFVWSVTGTSQLVPEIEYGLSLRVPLLSVLCGRVPAIVDLSAAHNSARVNPRGVSLASKLILEGERDILDAVYGSPNKESLLRALLQRSSGTSQAEGCLALAIRSGCIPVIEWLVSIPEVREHEASQTDWAAALADAPRELVEMLSTSYEFFRS